jgi:hypothetical protein
MPAFYINNDGTMVHYVPPPPSPPASSSNRPTLSQQIATVTAELNAALALEAQEEKQQLLDEEQEAADRAQLAAYQKQLQQDIQNPYGLQINSLSNPVYGSLGTGVGFEPASVRLTNDRQMIKAATAKVNSDSATVSADGAKITADKSNATRYSDQLNGLYAQPGAPLKPVPKASGSRVPSASQQYNTVNGELNAATTQENSDQSKVNADQSQVNADQNGSNGSGCHSNASCGLDEGEASADLSADEATLATDKATLATDQANVAKYKKELAGLSAVTTTASAYQASTPPITVSTPTTQAVAPQLAAATQKQTTALGKVNADKTALNAPPPPGMSPMALAHYYRRLNAQLLSDQFTLNADDAQVSADDSIMYSEQGQAVLADLQKKGIVNSRGQLINTSVPPPTEYLQFIADENLSSSNSADLQSDVFDTQDYGTSGTDAIRNLNQVLKPLGLEFQYPWKPATSAAGASTEQTQDDQAAAAAVAAWNTATAQDAYSTAQQTAQNDPSVANQVAANTAKGVLQQAEGYESNLYYSVKVPADQQNVQNLIAQWQKDPDAATSSAVYNAQVQLANDQLSQQQGNVTLYAGTALVLEKGDYGTLLTDQNKVLASTTTPTQCTADTPAQAQTLTNDALTPSELTASYWESEVALLPWQQAQWDLQVDPSNTAVLSDAGTLTPAQASALTPEDASDYVTEELDVANYNFAQASFDLDEGENIINPQTDADQTSAQTDWANYASSQHLKISDGQVADQLQEALAAGPSSEVDADAGMSELQGEQSQEGQVLADRSMMQTDWDFFTGSNQGTTNFLDEQTQQLQLYSAAGTNLSPQAYNLDYVNLMGTQSTQFGALLQSQVNDSQGWDKAQDVTEHVLEAAGTIALATVTGGALGVLVGTLFYAGSSQAFATVQNLMTVKQGGNVNDNSQISLVAAWTNNFHSGGDSGREKSGALLDLRTDTITGFTMSLGVVGGESVGELAVSSWFGGAKAATELELDGDLTAATEATDADATGADAASDANASDANKVPWQVRLTKSALAMTANQLSSGAGQVITANMQVNYQESHGELTSAQGSQEEQQAWNEAAFNLVTAPLVGAVGGVLEEGHSLAQLVLNFGVNTALTMGSNAASGQRLLGPYDWLSDIENTLSMAGIEALGRTRIANKLRQQQSDTESRPQQPDTVVLYTHDTSDPGLEWQPQTAAPTPTLTRPLTGFNPMFFKPEVVDDEFATLPTEDDIRAVSAILSQARDTPAPVIDPQTIKAAFSRYFMSKTDPDGEAVPSPAPSSGSSLASVNELARERFGVDLLTDGNRAPVRVLGGREFELRYRAAGGQEDAAKLQAFIKFDPNGTPEYIAVREHAADVPTLTHELIHSRLHPDFRRVAQQFVVNPDLPYSNLSEGAADFLTSQLMSAADSTETALMSAADSPEAGIVAEIVQEMRDDDFYRAAFHGDAIALEAFKTIATDKPGTSWESRPMELIEAKTGTSTPANMPAGPQITVPELKAILDRAFGGDRAERLNTGIAGASGSDFVFLDAADRAKVKAVLLNGWKGALLDPDGGAKAHTTNETDSAFVQERVNNIQDNKLEMRLPGGGSHLKLYFEPDEIDALRGDWTSTSSTMDNVEQFLDHLLSGAHFVQLRLTESAPDFFSAFAGGDPSRYTATRLANSHFLKEGSPWTRLPFSRGGLQYPKDVTSDTTPENPAILSAVLVGHTRATSTSDDGDTYFQLEGWPAVKRNAFLGRHRVDNGVHQDTGWNVSTFGASRFSEKAGTGKYGDAIQMLPSDEARRGLLVQKLNEQFTKQLLDTPERIDGFVGKIKTLVEVEGEKQLKAAVDFQQAAKAYQATSKELHKYSQSSKFAKDAVKEKGEKIVTAAVGGRTGVTGDIIASVTESDLKSIRRNRPFSSVARWQRNDAQAIAELATSAIGESVAEKVLTLANDGLDKIAGDGKDRYDYVKGKFDIDGEAATRLPGLLQTAVIKAMGSLLEPAGIPLADADALSKLEGNPDQLLTDILTNLNDPSEPLSASNDTDLEQAGRILAAEAASAASDEVWKATQKDARKEADLALKDATEKTLRDRATTKAAEIEASPNDYIAGQAASRRSLRDPWSRQERVATACTRAVEAATTTWGNTLKTEAERIMTNVLPGVLDDYVRAAGTAGSKPTISRAGFAERVSKAAQDIINGGGTKTQVLAGAQIAVETLKNIKNIVEGDKSGSDKLAKLWKTAQNAANNRDAGLQPGLDTARNDARTAVADAINTDIASRTTDTTKAAASWIARDPEFKRGTLAAAQDSIANQFKDIADFVALVGSNQAEAEKMAKTAARRAARGQTPVDAAKAKAEELLNAGLPEAVLQQNFRSNPQEISLSKWERRITRVMERHMRSVTYTAQSYEEIRALLPEKLQDKLPEKLSSFEVDSMTRKLAEVPPGLEKFIADIHSHPMGYDRRAGNRIEALVDKIGEFGRILSGSIPQWCGGDSHYSTSAPSKGTMKGAYALDQRAYKDWMEIYAGNPEKAAQVDLSITGVNFADTVRLAKLFPNPDAILHQGFRDPVAYIKEILLQIPGMFPVVGEITGIKEMVSRQLGGWRWNVGNQKFLDFLSLASETGQIVLLHNDWGEHAESAAGRPSAAKQFYEHLDLLKSVFARDEYENVRIVFAHTGIGRLVRPNDRMVDPDDGEETDLPNGIPEHIYQLNQLFKVVPNARVDISWNDVTQAYTHLAQVSERAAEAVINCFIEHQDRIFFGSDTVKPVNKGHYNQALMTGSPLFVEIARRDPDAAFKILRGNYDDLMKLAYQDSDGWTKTQLLLSTNKPSSEIFKKIQEMETRRAVLDVHRDKLAANARREFDIWAQKVRGNQSGSPGDWSKEVTAKQGEVSPALAAQLPRSTPQDQTQGVSNGPGTSGGAKNGVWWRRAGAGTTSVAGVAGIGVAVDFFMRGGIDRTGFLTPTTGGGFLKSLPGSADAGVLTSLGFLGRAALNLGRTAYLEQLRLQWEQIFEQAAVTRDGLNRYVSRLFNAAPSLGITALQRYHISAATEQFWTNYTYLRDQPLTADYTEQQRFLALHAKVGEYQITVSREGNLQESSLSAADTRRLQGRLFRSALLASYGVNEAVALSWLKTSGLHEIFGAQFLHQASDLADAQSASELLFRSMFLLGNAMLMTREGNSLIGGLFGITGTETNRFQKFLQRWGQLALGIGGIGWTVDGGLTTAKTIKSLTYADRYGDGITAALDAASTLARAAFTRADFQIYADEFRKTHALPMQSPIELAEPQLILAGALGGAMIIALAQDL